LVVLIVKQQSKKMKYTLENGGEIDGDGDRWIATSLFLWASMKSVGLELQVRARWIFQPKIQACRLFPF
jgi:hypothetical protein